MVVPNGQLLENPISNATQGKLRRQVAVTFTLPGHLDVVEVKRLAADAAKTSPYAWISGGTEVWVEDVFERSFLTRYTLRAYVIDLRLQPVFESDLIERIKRETTRRGWVDEAVVLASLGARMPEGAPRPAGS